MLEFYLPKFLFLVSFYPIGRLIMHMPRKNVNLHFFRQQLCD